MPTNLHAHPPVPLHNLARVIGSSERVELIVRLPHAALVREHDRVRWIPSQWLSLTAGELRARQQRNVVDALTRGRL